MATLLLWLTGPMQSWGLQSRFSHRDTAREPTKSGVVGLLCAALGKPRDEKTPGSWPSLRQLTDLQMGVRVDREGLVRVDYHTAQDVRKANGGLKETELSRRYYLADASFLVGLAGERTLLEQLDAALRDPCWHLYLGRKSFAPGRPVRLPDSEPHGPGLLDLPLERALWRFWPPNLAQARVVMDSTEGQAQQDVPLDFASRSFGLRYVETRFLRREDNPDVSV